jgi:glutamyl-tRNA reductase
MPGAPEAGTGRGLLVVGVNHRSSPLALRDRFALVEADLPAALETLKQGGIADAVLLATCDRLELVVTEASAAESFLPLVAAVTGVAADAVAAALYRFEGDAALRHLFAVASALDSHVIGEPQILGQLKAAHRTAAELGLVGARLEAALDAAYATARRVRRETRIAERPVSLAAAALQLARDIHGDLDRCAVLLLGPGEMGELMAEQFRHAGVAQLVVCGPAARARQAAERLVCNHLPLEDLDEALASADIVIAALGSGRVVLTAPRVLAALRRRPQRPLFAIDAATPADADPAINDLDGAFLYDLGDLERAAMAGRATRAAAASEAWRIVDAELEAFARRRAERRAVPAVVALRRHFERVRAEAALAAGGDVEAATRRLVNRLLHDPSEVLREMAGMAATDAAQMEDFLRRLFRLGDEEERE